MAAHGRPFASKNSTQVARLTYNPPKFESFRIIAVLDQRSDTMLLNSCRTISVFDDTSCPVQVRKTSAAYQKVQAETA